MTLPGLQKIEHWNYQEHIPLTPDLRIIGQIERS